MFISYLQLPQLLLYMYYYHHMQHLPEYCIPSWESLTRFLINLGDLLNFQKFENYL